MNASREFLARQGFIEVNTPKMIATATEGGASIISNILLRQRSIPGAKSTIV